MLERKKKNPQRKSYLKVLSLEISNFRSTTSIIFCPKKILKEIYNERYSSQKCGDIQNKIIHDFFEEGWIIQKKSMNWRAFNHSK